MSRLIDADKLFASIEEYFRHIEYVSPKRRGTENAIRKDIQGVLSQAPTIEAIPLDWIEDYIDKLMAQRNQYAYNTGAWRELDAKVEEITMMVEKWEKEHS